MKSNKLSSGLTKKQENMLKSKLNAEPKNKLVAKLKKKQKKEQKNKLNDMLKNNLGLYASLKKWRDDILRNKQN